MKTLSAPIRWGIIGCGDVTEVKSGPAFYKSKHSQLAAVTRRDTDKARDYAARHGVDTVHNNAEALIQDPNIDAIYVATPPESHLQYALEAAVAGKPCCVEKPMALNHKQCETMIEAFNQAQVPLFVAYYRRTLPRFLKIKQWLDENAIGDIRHISWNFRKTASDTDKSGKANWRTQPDQAGGGYFVDLASHGLDLFDYLLGPIQKVNGFATNQQQLYKAEDAVTAAWQFKNGVTGSGYWNFGAYTRMDEVEIIGSEGEIRFAIFEDKPVILTNTQGETAERITHPEHIQTYHVEAMNNHLLGKAIHPSPGESAARANWVMEMILKAE